MHPAAPPIPEPLRSGCEHDWPPMWETSSGSRHRCGYGSCRVLRVNDDDVLAYYDQAGRKLAWEPVPDYMRTWRDWWVPVLGPGAVDLDQIMRELHDYATVLTEVSKVYSELTGDQITKPTAAAHHVIAAAGRRRDEDIAGVLDRLAEHLDGDGHLLAARSVRDLREDYGGDPDLTLPDSGVLFRVLAATELFDVFFAEPGWLPAGPLCDDTLAIVSGTSPAQVVLRAADLPGGTEDPRRREQALRVLGQLCHDRGWRADLGDDGLTIISDRDAGAAAAAVAAALQAAGLGPVTLHGDDADTAAGQDGVHITDGTWPVQIHVPAGPAAAAALAGRLAGQEGWRADPAEPGWLAVIPALAR